MSMVESAVTATAAKPGIIARPLRETEYDAWNTLVAASPHGSIYSTPEYLDILCEAAGGKFSILGAFKAEELLGGVGLYVSKQRGGEIVSNRLLLYYNSLVTKASTAKYPSLRTARQLEILTALEAGLRELGMARIRLQCRHTLHDVRPFLAQGWSARPSYSYVVPISDLKAQYNFVEQNLRRLISRCQDAGLAVTSDDDFESFYRLHYETHIRKGAPLYLPKAQFQRYFTRLKEAGLGELFHARMLHGKVIASQLTLLGKHPVTHTVSAAADFEHLNLGATPFLRWSAFEALSKLGYQANDLTDAALNSVTHFKSQLGGELVMNTVLVRTDSASLKFYERLDSVLKRGKGLIKSALRKS